MCVVVVVKVLLLQIYQESDKVGSASSVEPDTLQDLISDLSCTTHAEFVPIIASSSDRCAAAHSHTRVEIMAWPTTADWSSGGQMNIWHIRNVSRVPIRPSRSRSTANPSRTGDFFLPVHLKGEESLWKCHWDVVCLKICWPGLAALLSITPLVFQTQKTHAHRFLTNNEKASEADKQSRIKIRECHVTAFKHYIFTGAFRIDCKS